MPAAATGGVLLLVEDDDAIGRLVKSYLDQQDGWRVVWLRSGEEALAELRRQPVRIVVLDIGLPDLDGFEVCRQIRARSTVPIVMLTARDEEPDRVAGLEVGADDYVLEAVLAARAGGPREGDPAPHRGSADGRDAGAATASCCTATRTTSRSTARPSS